jgi:hypothetical protein
MPHPYALAAIGVVIVVIVLLLVVIPFPTTQTHHFCDTGPLVGSNPATIAGGSYSVAQTVGFGWTTAPLHPITMGVEQGGSAIYTSFGVDGSGTFDASAGGVGYVVNTTSPPNAFTVYINGTYVIDTSAPLLDLAGVPACT